MGDIDFVAFASIVGWIIIVLGFASIFLPFAPSIPLVWLGIFIYAVSRHFVPIDRGFMAMISVIAVITVFLDYTLYKFGIHKFRAGGWGVIGGIVGFVVGSFISPLVSYVVGPIVGAVAFELLRGRDQVFSFKTGNTTVVAFMGGTIIKLVAALAMIGLFILKLQGKI